MGGVCCVAAKDRTISNGPGSEGVHGDSRCSPLWSIRLDNRGRVSSGRWLPDEIRRNDASDIKSITDVSAYASDQGSSPVENHRMGVWHKGIVNDENAQRTKTSAFGQSIHTNFSAEVNASTESPLVSDPASLKLSPSIVSVPSVATSPFSSHSHMLSPNSTPSRGARSFPENQLSQVSETLSSGRTSPIANPISEERQSSYVPSGSYELTKRSQGRASDGWSLNVFSELLSSSQKGKERWSFGSRSCSFTHDKSIGSVEHNSRSVTLDLQTCGVCSNALTDKSPCSSQKIFTSTELAAVGVLICGHVFHAECLESITPEIDKYDPACPICTCGKRQVKGLTGKALKAEKDMNSRSSKKSRNRVSTINDDSLELDYWKSNANTYKGKDVKLKSSPSVKGSSGKPFIRRHFSFGLKGSKSNPDSQTTIKNGSLQEKSSQQ